MSTISEQTGDNREFNVAAASDITVFFNGGLPGEGKTSANDTATKKYFNNYFSAKSYQLRCDETVSIIGINAITYTEPMPAIKDKGATERFDTEIITSIKIRVHTANTNISLRAR